MAEILFTLAFVEILFIFILLIWSEIRTTMYKRKVKMIQDQYDKLFEEHLLILKEQNVLMKETTQYLNDTITGVKGKKVEPTLVEFP